MIVASRKRYRPFWFQKIVCPALAAASLLWASPDAAFAADAASACANGPPQTGVQNAQSLTRLPLNLFGRPEIGWAFYEPLIANEIGTECPAASPGFAKALAQWQSQNGQAGGGVMNALTLSAMSRLWQSRRPFVVASRHHCPDPPDEQSLARATATESYGGKEIQLRPDTLNAYRKLVAAARAAGVLKSDKDLQIFSAYRSPSYDAARCAREQNCQGVVRATCSAHRTGYAMDVYLGAAPGYLPDSSADVNRLFISKGATYRWLVKNAAKFGFANYPFEPWHWEFSATAATKP